MSDVASLKKTVELSSNFVPSSHRPSWWQRLLASPTALISIGFILTVIIIASTATLLAPEDPLAQNVRNRLATPSLSHWFGTDALGRDVFSRIIYGSRISLLVAFVTVGVSATIGVSIGILAGYVGGLWDELVMRLIDAIISFPAIILALTFITVFGATLTTVIIALCVVSIPLYVRVMRAQVLVVKNGDYVLAAKSIGANTPRIMLRHILPNSWVPISVAATLGMSYAILAEASLSFLGAGIQPPTPTWGGMLNDASRYIYSSTYMTIFPGAAIFLLVLSLNYLGDVLQEIMDPRAH